jgi:DNA-binding NtrC family response regulator
MGQSPMMKAVYEFIATAGPSDRPVLILGPSGAEDLPRTIRTNGGNFGEVDIYDKELDAFRKSLFERILTQAGGNLLDAARRLGLHPTYFARLCRDLNVKS